MPHITYPPTFLSGTLLQQANLSEMREVVRNIRNFLDQNVPGAYQVLASNIDLESTNTGELRDAIARYNAEYAGQEVPHGNNNEETPPGAPSPLLKPFGQFDITEADKTTVTSGLFSNGAGSLTSFHTASLLGDTSASYVEVYQEASTNSTAQVQFAVGYAHINGSGSIGNTTKTTAGNRETAALYRQFRNVILAPNTDKFTFTSAPAASASGYDDFYFVAFNRAQMREKVDPGNWELRISGSGGITKLIDDSGATTNTDVNVSGRVFNVVTGSIASGTAVTKTTAANETEFGAAGLFYPDLGIILLNPEWVGRTGSGSAELSPGRSSNTLDNNSQKIFTAISGAAYFSARREEEISSVSYFTRARNDEFNFSSNPTYKTTSTDSGGQVTNTGAFKVPSFKGDPRAYITQVGLYDNDNDLIAVAKLSQPVLKSFSREAVIKVKLDY